MNDEDLLKLDNQLCFSIYVCSKEIIKRYRPYLDELGITYSQYLVLLVLWEHGSSTVNDLGQKLYLDSGTLTPMLKRMEQAGFIHRTRSETDERKVVVSLTASGEELKNKAYCIPESLLLHLGMNTEEVGQLTNLFKNIIKTISHSKETI